ncbi:hypothetical protein AIT98_000571 [Salmonella enterica subsp. indica]|uniref:hypothetical protein n=1 Tax=Salmonella enterica TaxID=28901 RepID=UPI001C3792E1|nr:hypothetical protein [Salmonella enterica]HBC0059329.1 hypothetical protein [Salmonella enterica]HCL5303276.1 hypothetical protein [Salmonella enterica]
MAVLTRPLSASEAQKAKPAAKDYELFVRTNDKKSGASATNVPALSPTPPSH